MTKTVKVPSLNEGRNRCRTWSRARLSPASPSPRHPVPSPGIQVPIQVSACRSAWRPPASHDSCRDGLDTLPLRRILHKAGVSVRATRGGEYRDHVGQRERSEESALQSLEEQEWNEDHHDDDRREHHRRSNLIAGIEDHIQGRPAILFGQLLILPESTIDVLDIDDRIVDEHADGDTESARRSMTLSPMPMKSIVSRPTARETGMAVSVMIVVLTFIRKSIRTMATITTASIRTVVTLLTARSMKCDWRKTSLLSFIPRRKSRFKTGEQRIELIGEPTCWCRAISGWR